MGIKRKVTASRTARTGAAMESVRGATVPAGSRHSTDVLEQLAVHRQEQVSYW